jgi:hypothetical protein
VSSIKEQYVGIDLAGDSGSTGVAVIRRLEGKLSYHVPDGEWTNSAGLKSLAALVDTSTQAAVDQPFSYSRETMLLLGDSSNAVGNLEVSDYSTRVTDEAMRDILKGLGLKTKYVMSPNRCQNIWRAVALAKLNGLTRSQVCNCKSRIVETHPRVVWSLLLGKLPQEQLQAIIRGYKGTDDHDLEVETRQQILALFEENTGITPLGEDETQQASTRSKACINADNIEALACALVAMLHVSKKTMLAGFSADRPDFLSHEGAAVLPAQPWPLLKRNDA